MHEAERLTKKLNRLRTAAKSALGRLEWLDDEYKSERPWIEMLEKALKYAVPNRSTRSAPRK